MKDYFKLRHALTELFEEHRALRRTDAELKEQADALCEAGAFDLAVRQYEELLDRNPRDPELWCALGKAHAKQGRHSEACEALLKSVRLDPNQPEVHHALGAAWLQAPQLDSCCTDYLRLLDADAGGYPSIQERLEAAVQLCERRLQEAASTSKLHATLGHLAMARQRLDEAVAAYNTAVNLASDDLDLADCLARALFLQGDHMRAHLVQGRLYDAQRKYRKAIEEFERGLASPGARVDDYTSLASAYVGEEQYARAEETCRLGTERFGANPDIYYNWCASLYFRNRHEEALLLAERAAAELKDPLLFLHQRNLLVPILYRDDAQVEHARAGFIAGLDRFCSEIASNWDEAVARPSDVVMTNFFLHYQGRDDTELLARHGELIHRLMGAAHPQWSKRPRLPASDGKTRLRIGYLSADMRMHSVGKIIYGWLAEHDRSQFEIFCYFLGNTDALARQFALASDHYYQLPADLDRIAQQVLDDDLHILVHPGLGMLPLSTQLAALHLAPIQCAAWGHPVTTGLPSIDYFLSNELMEPDDAERHYTESLIRLPGLGVNVPRPYLPGQRPDREALGLPGDAVLYISPQSLFKYLPQHDDIYARIAEQVPNSRFLFFNCDVPELEAFLRERLERKFLRLGLDPAQHLMFFENFEHARYLHLTRACDVFLDTMGWSGGLTTLDALAVELPVVTCPGEFMRGRQSYGMLRALGITATIAKDVEEYVEIAVRLGKDPAEREHLRTLIASRHDRLYNDKSCVRAVEEFYRWAVAERR